MTLALPALFDVELAPIEDRVLARDAFQTTREFQDALTVLQVRAVCNARRDSSANIVSSALEGPAAVHEVAVRQWIRDSAIKARRVHTIVLAIPAEELELRIQVVT
eukprot:CAMPEP_0204085568 /NCGR_PEP_ID=MMETSP0360-20130528/181778_1 /ASSEMBLY_ACC=CAM_ASM_000342 /TAXON_ID=268821 /ORGANISM="Scrippsiella Hangoei, Strain SHTV-5" /LENGTH=105 /DNA_ID=CAMNT_0051034629 /DNA_START=193 /DNA_END=507 /DNA_ORIENTATION=+